MLTNRTEQERALELGAAARFESEARMKMQTIWPSRTSAMAEEDLTRRVRAGIAAAQGYGLDDRRSILRFLNLRFGFGDGFPYPEQQWIRTVLAMDVEAEEKLELIVGSATR